MKYAAIAGVRIPVSFPLTRARATLGLFVSSMLAVGATALGAVPTADTTLQAPIQGYMPIFSPLCGYEVGEVNVTDPNKDMPVFGPYESSTDAWWDNLVAELLQARISNVSFATRGTMTTSPGDMTGPGNMNPRRLQQFIDALNRAGVASQFKISCFLDSPSAEEVYTNRYGLAAGTLENMADNSTGVTNHWQEVWWLRFIKPWFDTIPQNMWFLENGKPRLEFWGLGNKTTNQQGNCSPMLNYISTQMQASYGMTPAFVGACGQDTTFATNPLVIGNNPWFTPPSSPFRYSTTSGTNYTAGTVVPGFIDPGFYTVGGANYQNYNRVIRRNKIDGTGVNGDTFKGALDAAISANCHFNLIEGWTNVIESAGVYRDYTSHMNTWDYPNQYINLLRPYTDLRTVTLRLEAEGCDEFSDTTTGNSGGAFIRSSENLDVRGLTGTPAVTASTFLTTSIAFTPTNGMDGSFGSKWVSNGSLPQWLQYDYGSGRAAVINTYYLTSADNAPERDPGTWTFQGSNNGTTWTTLDTRTGEVFAARKQTNAYTFTNSTAYRYYRLNVTAAPGGPTTQLQVEDLKLKGSSPTGGGWAVTNTAANEWIAFYGVFFSNGYYKFPVRYSSTASHTMRLTVDNVALPDVVLPSTGSMDTFDTAYIGSQFLGHGTHNIKVTFVDGGVDLDWLFIKKADPMVSFKSDLTNCYLTAESGGNGSFSSNRTTEGIWERFSVNSITGGNGALSNGTVANLQPYVGYYMTAEGNGGLALTANRRVPSTYEKFTLVKVSGSTGSGIVTGDKVALRSNDGTHYITVVSGSSVNVSGTSIGAAQTFAVNMTAQ
jgi:hypothetical protein